MCENNKHPTALKLFGRKILVPEFNIPANSELRDATGVSDQRAKPNYSHVKDSNKEDRASVLRYDKNASETVVKANNNQLNSRPEGKQADPSCSEQEKVVKKPDKILPCPRCNSLDTKFCYFNNYNVNQPRHFCKNCQRYWTAGGTIRNVPVGAGRRKNRQLTSQYHQILLPSDTISANRIETTDMVSRQLLSSGECMMACKPSVGDSALLKFGSGVSLCESMKIVPNFGDPRRCARGSVACRENGEKPYACRTSVAPSSNSSFESNENSHQRENDDEGGSYDPFKQISPLNYYPGNSGSSSGAFLSSIQKQSDQVYVSSSSNSNPVEWCSSPSLALPGLCGPNTPLQLVPALYQSCMPLMSTVGGNLSWTASGSCLSPSSTSNSCCSSNGLPNLGKHCRDRNLLEEEKTEKSVLMPKTLKIDDQHNT